MATIKNFRPYHSGDFIVLQGEKKTKTKVSQCNSRACNGNLAGAPNT